MKKEKIWTTKDGKEIPYSKIEDRHLLNILAMIKRKAKEMDGEIIDGGGYDMDEIWYVEGDEQDWRKKLGYKPILKEVKRRGLKIKKQLCQI